VIDRRSIAGRLETRRVADYVVIQRDQELGVVDDLGMRRAEHRTRWQITVHVDMPAGRGSAQVTLDALDGDPEKIVEEAVALAEHSVGPAWATVPAAAPARVELTDPALATQESIDVVADGVLKTLPRGGATISGRATVLREHVMVSARQGFHAEWQATHARVDAVVALGANSLAVWREARRRDGLDLDAAITDALADLKLLAVAGRPVAGPCALVLGPDALLHDGLGVWAAFATQADAVVARQGLTRYHEHVPVVPGADQIVEPLSISSNGALPFGVRSAPLGDDGAAVRKFALVDHGIAAGLGLSPREAALRHRDPNGGVRNLVVELGSWSGKVDATAGRVVELRRLRALEIDPYTGDASLEIALGIDGTKPFAGGTIRLDLIEALARARRAQTRVRRGPYDGPSTVLLERAELIA
jgi:predicted Zn-dependent protease